MKKSWSIVVLAFVLVAIIGVSGYTYPSDQEKQTATDDGLPSATIAQGQPNQTSQSRHATKYAPFRRELFAWPEGVTCLAVLATLFFIGWQALLTRQAIAASDVASKVELRAYLTTSIGVAIYQQRRTKEDGGDLKFQGLPNLVNTGQTPAKKIKFRARAGILPQPLPITTNLQEGINTNDGESFLGAQQSAQMNATVDGFWADDEVDDVKMGFGKNALYVWGYITYEDVFGDPHSTRFCHHVYWRKDNVVHGFYVPDRNNAD